MPTLTGAYYFTLVLTPMVLLSGVFFPVEQLPAPIRLGIDVLPLSHAVVPVRPLMSGGLPADPPPHVAALILYTVLAEILAVTLIRRRLLA